MGDVRPFPRAVEAPVDRQRADVIEVLADALARARAGDLSAIAIVGLNGNGTAFVSRWSVQPSENCTIIGLLAVLQHDMAAESK